MTNKISAVLLDLDGTVYSGKAAVPGAADFVASLGRRGVAHLFVTNRANRSPRAVAEQLSGLGIPCEAEAVLTSAQATAARLGGGRAFCLGEEGLLEAFEEAGIAIVEEESETLPDWVVVSYDRGLSYRKLELAIRFIRAGAGFIATNPDLLITSDEGLSPEAGVLLAALEAATGQRAEIVGKPERAIIDAAIARIGRPREETVIIGDNLATDIAAGHNAGLRSALILTGISTRAEAEAAARPPHWIAADYGTLESQLFGQ
jgi:4-nitrophenyl phosphatase